MLLRAASSAAAAEEELQEETVSLAVVKEISVDTLMAAVLSELDFIFTLRVLRVLPNYSSPLRILSMGSLPDGHMQNVPSDMYCS